MRLSRIVALTLLALLGAVPLMAQDALVAGAGAPSLFFGCQVVRGRP